MPPYQYDLPKRRLVSQDDAAIVERADIPRSVFTGSWSRLMTFDAGYLYPFLVDEILPGDHMRYNITAYVRMSTPLFPLFSNQRIDTFIFYVPARTLWNNFTKMFGEQIAGPGDSISYTVPQIVSAAGGFPANNIYDHMGLPVVGQIAGGEDISVNALPFRAYNSIYNEWFRDQNVINAATINIDDGPDAVGDYSIRKRAKSHDYFTSALPWPQKFTAPNVPVAGQAPVIGIGTVNQLFDATPATVYETPDSSRAYAFAKLIGISSGGTAANQQIYVEGDQSAGGYPQIFADLSEATGVAINTFRQAFLIQQLLERDARGGTRYVEILKSHWGVTSPDFRLQRPEYIGGGQSPLTLTPIAQTAPNGDDTGLGALGAAGTGVGTHSASYAATEHGYIIGLINIRTELHYQQGLHKMWTRQTRYDFYVPALAGLGEQAILRQEIYCTGNAANDGAVFGYQERWHEYRTRTSEVTGMFRSTTANNIDPWHLAQEFGSAPTLSQTFLEEDPPMARVQAAGSNATTMQYLADIHINRTATRAIPTFGTPVKLGRF